MFTLHSRPMPEGLSFEIDELIMLRNWAENNALMLTLKLDHTEGKREFEEYACLGPQHPAGESAPLVALWRAQHAINVTSRTGASRQFISMPQALAALDLRNGMIEMRQDRIRGF